jgi:hypothetical protein
MVSSPAHVYRKTWRASSAPPSTAEPREAASKGGQRRRIRDSSHTGPSLAKARRKPLSRAVTACNG